MSGDGASRSPMKAALATPEDPVAISILPGREVKRREGSLMPRSYLFTREPFMDRHKAQV